MQFDENKHPRDDKGKFTDSNRNYRDDVNERLHWARENNIKLPLNVDGSLDDIGLQRMHYNHENPKMTPAKKIESIHIDFDKDNILPELNNETVEKLGTKENKKVLLKKSIIDRNFKEHNDLTREDFEQIINQALYDSPEVFPANSKKPDYYHLASIVETTSKGKPEIGLVLIDIDNQKDNFEIVHAHYVRKRSYNRLKTKQ